MCSTTYAVALHDTWSVPHDISDVAHDISHDHHDISDVPHDIYGVYVRHDILPRHTIYMFPTTYHHDTFVTTYVIHDIYLGVYVVMNMGK